MIINYEKKDNYYFDWHTNRYNGDFNFWMQQQQLLPVHKKYIYICQYTSSISENTTASDIATTAVDSAESVTSIKKDGYLAIPIAGLSQTASFYKADLDGTEVELVALKDSKGNLRTAFNACQVCYSSGRGYYRQEGEYLVCQNCGNSFTIDQVGIASGGCNPWPILDSDRTVTDDEIQISYDVLKATADELPKFFQ